jgi:hypothetical protein
MKKLTIGACLLALLSITGISVLAFKYQALSTRLRELELGSGKPGSAQSPDRPDSRTVAELQDTVGKLESELAAEKKRAVPPKVKTVEPVHNDHHDPNDAERRKAAIVDRMKNKAQKFIEDETPKLGLTTTQQTAVLGILYDQISDISRLDPGSGRERVEVEMERINQSAMSRILSVLKEDQRTKYIQSASTTFGTMMVPKNPASGPPPGVGDKPGDRPEERRVPPPGPQPK